MAVSGAGLESSSAGREEQSRTATIAPSAMRIAISRFQSCLPQRHADECLRGRPGIPRTQVAIGAVRQYVRRLTEHGNSHRTMAPR